MTWAAKVIWQILKDAGVEVPDEIRIERTYVGRNQRAAGWATWIARGPDSMILCGGIFPIREIHKRGGEVSVVNHERWIDPGPIARAAAEKEGR